MKQWLEKKKIRWHRPHDPSDHRLWMHIRNSCFSIETYFLKKARGCRAILCLNSGDGDQITVGLGFPWLFSIWVSFESRILRRLMPGEWLDSHHRPGEKFWSPVQRRIGVRVFDSAIWFSLWENPMEWRSSDPQWWAFNFRPIDLLLGRDCIVAEETKLEQSISVRMPEKVYTGELRLYRVSHKRFRWPTVRHFDRYNIEMDEPIPVPGKGENAWDMDQDAIYSIGGLANTASQAIGQLLDSVNTSRVRYGGPLWLPEST